MARMPRLVALAAVTLAVSGCVSQEKYNALKLDRDRLTEQLVNASREASTAQRTADLYKQSLDSLNAGDNSKEGMIANLTSSNAELQRQIEEMNRKYGEAMNNMGKLGTALPIALTNELSQFAAQNPDLVEFDAARGIVKFKSDVTFALGSAEVTPQARTAIGRFSQILNSGNASGYELLVAGHTDNIRVNNPATIKAGHKDNWYLSAHRALEVAGEMRGQGVAGQRMGAIGYADQRPAADNGSEGGRSRNRRVEVLILPTTVRAGSTVATGTQGRPAPTTPRRVDLNKDTVNTDTGPVMNK